MESSHRLSIPNYIILIGFFLLTVFSFPGFGEEHSFNRNQQFNFSQINSDRAMGYQTKNALKMHFNNFGSISDFLPDLPMVTSPEGLYGKYQYIPTFSFILGIPGRDSLGNPYPWAIRPAVDSLTGQVFPDSFVYWGPTVSESWFDRTPGKVLTDWEAVENSHTQLFGNATSSSYAFNYLYDWSEPVVPLLAHSDYPSSWPTLGSNPIWPGFTNPGSISPRAFFSDQDVYWEMDDRFADRDVDPTQGYPTGIRVKAMASNFSNIPGGMIFLHYRLINESPYNYQNIYAGFYFDADIYHRMADGSYLGRTNSDDMIQFNRDASVCYIWDLDGYSGGATDLAYVGVGMLETPPASEDIDLNADGQPDVFVGEPTGVTGWHWFNWYFRPGSNDGGPNGPFSGDGITPVSPDKEAIQYKLLAGDTSSTDSPPYWHNRNRQHFFHGDPSGFINPRFDSNSGILSQYPMGLDAVCIMNCGPFNLDAGDSADVVGVLLAAKDSTTLLTLKRLADRIWEYQSPKADIHIQSGNGGEVFSDNAEVSWSVNPHYPHPVDKVDLWLGYGDNETWELLDTAVTSPGSYSFSTQNWKDGIFYRLGVVSHQGEGVVYGASQGYFTINNTGIPTSPEIMVQRPLYNDTISGVYSLHILAGDADQDSIFLTVRDNFRGAWCTLIENQPFPSRIVLDTRNLFNGENNLQFYVRDATGAFSPMVERNVVITNPETTAPDTIFDHVCGVGNGLLQLNPIDRTQMTGHTYRLSFDQPNSLNIYDVDAGIYLWQQVSYFNTMQNLTFDGLSLKIMGFFPPEVDSLYWKHGNSDWEITVAPAYNGNPTNYEIVFGQPDSVQHLTTNALLFTVPFRVYNRNMGIDSSLKLYGFDHDFSGDFSSGDKIYLKEKVVAGDTLSNGTLTYELTFLWDSTSTAPLPGDTFRITTIGYFWEADTIYFRSPLWMGISSSDGPKNFVLFPNYPNPFNPRTTIRYFLPRQERVNLSIFNILGQRVVTLVNTPQKPGEHQVEWDGCNHLGIPVSSGVYLLRIQAGQQVKTRKMILLK